MRPGSPPTCLASPDLLTPTYAPDSGFQRRFGPIRATPELSLIEFSTAVDDVVAAGGDHALLVADLQLRGSPAQPRQPRQHESATTSV